MFERFTYRARQVVVHAQREARDQNHDYIGTEHMLLGLLLEGEGLGAIALNGMGVRLEETRAKVHDIVPAGSERPKGSLPFTPHANKTCELALREALSLGHNYIGTEHSLLGLITDSQPSDYPRTETGQRKNTPETRLFPDDERSVVGEVFASFNVDLDEMHKMVSRSLLGDEDTLWKLRERASS